MPSLRAIALYRNSLFEGENWDLTLVAQFDDAEGLAAYADHPDHQPRLYLTAAPKKGPKKGPEGINVSNVTHKSVI